MRILIFGGDGMLGHQLWESWHGRHEVHLTLRKDAGAYVARGEAFRARAMFGVDVRRTGDIVDAVAAVRPDAVINAVGIVKQRPSAKEFVPSIEVNALFPHQLARVSAAAGARMVHLSTDCVFSGDKGQYVESDRPDPVDLYGRSKLLGEVSEAPNCLTLRTSIIGLELGNRGGLVEWFLAQRGRIQGFRRAIYSGLTTRRWRAPSSTSSSRTPPCPASGTCRPPPSTSSRCCPPSWPGSAPRDVEIAPEDTFTCDRSLDSAGLQARSAYRVPSWDAMLDELAESIRRRERET